MVSTIIGSGIPSMVISAGPAAIAAGAIVLGALALVALVLVVADVRSAS